MMDKEYIEKEKALEAITNLPKVCGCAVYDCDDVEDAINNIPPAYVQEIRHGKWVISSDGYYPYCSECGKEPKEMSEFCPKCGAKMDKED